MSKIVLDASAMLAVLNHEPGSEKLTPEMLSNAAGSTVNLAEVHQAGEPRGRSR
jgi:PIN domain nuclease of toxin-antitoxin system